MVNSTSEDIIHDILDALCRYPNNISFVIDEKSYTYKQLSGKIGGVISQIRELHDEVIGIVSENNIETYASILAVLFCGKSYVILHPSYPDDRNQKIAEVSGLKAVLYSEDIISTKFRKSGYLFIDTRKAKEIDLYGFKYESDSRNNAYIIFTSGSTGEPKGVPITRSNLNAFYKAYKNLDFKLGERDRTLQMFELTFDVSVVSYLYPLTLGASIYTVGYKDVKHFKVVDLLESSSLSFAAITPSLLHLLSPYFSEINLPELKYLVVTAEASQVKLLEDFKRSAPNAQFLNLYGPTEATIYCSCYIIPRTGIKHYNGMIAIGKPFSGVKILIMDEGGHQLPPFEIGELWVSGPQVMNGYLNDQAKTSAVLVNDQNGEAYYKTGDLCFTDSDGDIIYCGRKDNQIKIQGFRIELSEIEYTAKQFFSDSFNVVAIPMQKDGVYVELHLVVEASECEEDKLSEFLKGKLPHYMQPRAIHCISQFPTTNSNKVDRKKIAQLI